MMKACAGESVFLCISFIFMLVSVRLRLHEPGIRRSSCNTPIFEYEELRCL